MFEKHSMGTASTHCDADDISPSQDSDLERDTQPQFYDIKVPTPLPFTLILFLASPTTTPTPLASHLNFVPSLY